MVIPKVDWYEWHRACVYIRVRRKGSSKVIDVDCDDGIGGHRYGFKWSEVPLPVRQKLIQAINEEGK